MGKSVPRAGGRKGKQAAAAAAAASDSDSDAPTAAAASASASSAVAALAAPSTLEDVNAQMGDLLQRPAAFFAADPANAALCLATTKALYDLAKANAPAFLDTPDSVPRLLTHSSVISAQPKGKGKAAGAAAAAATGTPFSNEQIFAQLSLHTTPLLKRMEAQIKVLRAHVDQQEKERAAAEAEADAEADAEAEAEAEGMDDDDEDADLDEDEEMGAEEEGEDEEDDEDAEAEEDGEDAEEEEGEGGDDVGASGEYKGRGGVVEDAFFSLDDMEKFADQFEDEDDNGDIDLDGDDEEGGEDDEDQEDGEDEDEDADAEDDAMDVAALKRRAIRMQHDAKLKPLQRPLREELADVDLDEDVGEVNLDGGERYDDFFDPPPAELLRGGAVGKKGNKGRAGPRKAKSLESMYAEEDANEETYVDEDYTDEFGGAFKQLRQSERAGLLGGKTPAPTADEDDEAALAASAPLTSGGGEAKPAEEEGPLSNYEKQSRKLASQISALETKIVQPREWAQLGEVSGKNRPVDALLTTNLEFEHAGKVAPVITQAYTEEIEAVIRRRIIAEQFDDVVRKREEDVAGAGRKKDKDVEPVNDQKSAVGLGEVYEQEAQATLAQAQGKMSASEEKVSAAHAEVGQLMGALFHKLDALCNFHFTPRSIHADELSVRAHAAPNVSSISLEEAMPGHVSSAAAQAPQEAYDVSQQAMVGETERSAEEKGTRRRRIKAQKKKKADERAAFEKRTIVGMGAAAQGNAAEGILRKAISSKELKAATTARNVIQAGGKGAAAGGSNKKGKATVVAHGQNTKFGSSGEFFGKMQSVANAPNKKQRTH